MMRRFTISVLVMLLGAVCLAPVYPPPQPPGSGTGDALTSEGLDQFAHTSPVEFGTVVDTAGSGSVLRSISPPLVAPTLEIDTGGIVGLSPGEPTIFLKRDPESRIIEPAINHQDVELVEGALVPGAMPIVNSAADRIELRHALFSDIEGALTDAQAALTAKPLVSVVATSNLDLDGPETLDGVTGAVGLIVLCTSQTTTSQNGPWVMQNAGWSRPDWYANGNTTQAIFGATARVRFGTLYKGSTWTITFPFSGTITIDTTGTSWTIIASALNATTTVSNSVLANNYATLADDTYSGQTLTVLANSGGVTQWQVVYLNGSSQWVLADADGSGTYPARGIAVETKSTTQATIVMEGGTFRDDGGTAWTPGGTIFLSATAGGLTQTAPATSGNKVQVIGYALTAHVVRVKIGTDYGTVP